MSRTSKSSVKAAGREAPGPWRIGERDETGIQVLDANGEPVAVVLTAPLRSDSTLETIQELIANLGNRMVGERRCANPACGRLFDAPSRKQKHCSSRCAMATQPHIIAARERARRAYELRLQGLVYRRVAELCGYSSAHRARQVVLGYAGRNRLPRPTAVRTRTDP